MPSASRDQTQGSLPGASIYRSLLERALEVLDRSGQPAPTDAFADIVQYRGRALAGWRAGTDGLPAAEAVSTQVAYDIALIRYARCLGMTVGPDDFDPPLQGRREIERWVSERGIELP